MKTPKRIPAADFIVLDDEPTRRQRRAMACDSKATTVGSLGRINLRLPAQTFDGLVARERWNNVAQANDGLRHG